MTASTKTPQKAGKFGIVKQRDGRLAADVDPLSIPFRRQRLQTHGQKAVRVFPSSTDRLAVIEDRLQPTFDRPCARRFLSFIEQKVIAALTRLVPALIEAAIARRQFVETVAREAGDRSRLPCRGSFLDRSEEAFDVFRCHTPLRVALALPGFTALFPYDTALLRPPAFDTCPGLAGHHTDTPSDDGACWSALPRRCDGWSPSIACFARLG